MHFRVREETDEVTSAAREKFTIETEGRLNNFGVVRS